MKRQAKPTTRPVITIHAVTKIYKLRHIKPTLTDLFFNPPNKGSDFRALNKVNLVVHEGERIGIIGKNGSGKTTLLKIIAGITTPTEGRVEVRGKVVSLIDLSAGFHDDLTGKENIFLNGMLLGLSHQELKRKYQQIVEFADIGSFIHQPLYTYSSGMALRLGFSIAVHSDPDIFLLDEGFAVGDENFRKKCEQKIREFKDTGKTVIIVSHWKEFLEKNCNRLIFFESGKIVDQKKL